jgi:FMN phosphatase YigB (HAD superfamily)
MHTKILPSFAAGWSTLDGTQISFCDFGARGEPIRKPMKASFDPREIDIVSVDLFDTVLLRDHRCERRRFLWMARGAQDALRCAGHNISLEALYRSRLDAQHLAYRAMESVRPQGEVPLALIHRLQTTILGLPVDVLEILKAAELRFEASNLRRNQRLLNWLAALHAGGARIIAISDSYLPRDALCELLDRIAPGHPINAVYSSAEFNLTKRSSELFGAVLERENVPAERTLHLGDDRRADFDMARKAGLRSRLMPRRLIKFLRKFDGAVLLASSIRPTVRLW